MTGKVARFILIHVMALAMTRELVCYGTQRTAGYAFTSRRHARVPSTIALRYGTETA